VQEGSRCGQLPCGGGDNARELRTKSRRNARGKEVTVNQSRHALQADESEKGTAGGQYRRQLGKEVSKKTAQILQSQSRNDKNSCGLSLKKNWTNCSLTKENPKTARCHKEQKDGEYDKTQTGKGGFRKGLQLRNGNHLGKEDLSKTNCLLGGKHLA